MKRNLGNTLSNHNGVWKFKFDLINRFVPIVKWFRLGICFGSPLPTSVSLSPYIHPPSSSQYFMYWGKMRRKVISVYYILIENSTSTTSFCLQQSKRRDSQEFWLHFTVFECVRFNLKFTENLYQSRKFIKSLTSWPLHVLWNSHIKLIQNFCAYIYTIQHTQRCN